MEVKLIIIITKKGHIAQDYKKWTRDRSYGFNKPQANVSSSNDAINIFSITFEFDIDFHDTWLLDSNATYHITPIREWFHNYKVLSTPFKIYMGDDGQQEAMGIGFLYVKIHTSQITQIDDILHTCTFFN